MKALMDIIAKALGVLLYPLFVPTYGMLLFCYAFTGITSMPFAWRLVAIIGTFLLTCLLPLTAIWILIRKGVVSDLQIENSSERTMPYIYTILGFSFWCYLMITILHAPVFMCFVSIGATIAITLIAVINKWWKISAHLSGFGGLVGSIFAYHLAMSIEPSWSNICLWLSASLVLMYARVYVKAHTPAQVCAGWLMGMTCTFVPYCLFVYAV